METTYSRTKFEGYKYRFTVQFTTDREYPSNIDIYSNSDNYKDLEDFINSRKSEKVKSFYIVNRATKEYDEMCAVLIEETLSNL